MASRNGQIFFRRTANHARRLEFNRELCYGPGL